MKRKVCVGCGFAYESRGRSSHQNSCRRYLEALQKALTPLEITMPSVSTNIEASMDEGPDFGGCSDPGSSRDVDIEMNEPPPREPTPVPEYRSSGLPNRKTRLPARFRDIPPPPPPPIPITDVGTNEESPDIPALDISMGEDPVIPDFETESNTYGVYRVFRGGLPTYTPDEVFHLDQVLDSPNFNRTGSAPDFNHTGSAPATLLRNPFSNLSILRLMNWFYNASSSKNLSDVDTLVHEVICAPDFEPGHFADFRASREAERLDKFCNDPDPAFPTEDGWIQTSVKISVPCEKVQHRSESDAPVFEVEGLFYRRPLEVIKTAFREKTAEHFHNTPFKEYWKPSPDSPPERIYSELYNSDAYIQEHERIKARPSPQEPQLETVIAAVMLWSDATQLANFGTASLWPIYLYLGNLSKYTRLKPTSFAAHHLAYIPSLGDKIQDFYKETFGKAASSEMLTHLRRELMHAIWLLLLDDDFMKAYINGLVVEFVDGIRRLLFPRFFIYGADYPEKILLACIKYLGEFPCPRCLIPKIWIPELGTENDKKRRMNLARVDDKHRRDQVELARKRIYEDGASINSKPIQNLLGPQSWTPTRNAFSVKLSPHGFDYHSMFVPDLLHEFELGIWKATFTHLIRILCAQGGDGITQLNLRYRQVPTFGRGTIRKFANNASAMKKLAARDYEDLLQCAIPVFEGLLPTKHDKIIHVLIFELATWHGLAKLRLHTESTISALENSTKRLGSALRRFLSKTCTTYETRELPAETAARGRRKAALTKKKAELQKKRVTTKKSTVIHKRKFNLACYKPHSLPDYAKAIRMFGTTDNFSTQSGELEHRRVKRLYPRAHKGKHTAGIAKQIRRERTLHNILEQHRDVFQPMPTTSKRKRGNDGEGTLPSSNPSASAFMADGDQEPMPLAPASLHYQMSDEIRHKMDIPVWLGNNKDDPALHASTAQDFLPRLKDHLLGRLRGLSFSGDDVPFTPEERSKVVIVNNRLYRHKTLRVNYTTYDLRRCQDSLNPRTHPNIMVLSHEDDDDAHPYWYAKIIEIFHAFVRHPSHPEPVSMNFLWVRWYGRNLKHRLGWKAKHLPRVGFIDSQDTLPFGFLDPIDVIRGCHLIPAFHHGRTDELMPPSIVRLSTDNNEDWLYYYVNIFVDRDMLMRYRGGGVGHKSTRAATDTFLKDRDRKDKPNNGTDASDSEDELEESDAEDNDRDPNDNVENAKDDIEETQTDDNIGIDPEGTDRSTEDDVDEGDEDEDDENEGGEDEDGENEDDDDEDDENEGDEDEDDEDDDDEDDDDEDDDDEDDDDEDDDDAAFEEEFDYGYDLNYEGEASDEEGQDAEDDDGLGLEDSRNDDEEDTGYADL